MRLSTLIARVEDRVVADAPKAKAKAQHATFVARCALSRGFAKLAMATIPTPSTPCDDPALDRAVTTLHTMYDVTAGTAADPTAR